MRTNELTSKELFRSFEPPRCDIRDDTVCIQIGTTPTLWLWTRWGGGSVIPEESLVYRSLSVLLEDIKSCIWSFLRQRSEQSLFWTRNKAVRLPRDAQMRMRWAQNEPKYSIRLTLWTNRPNVLFYVRINTSCKSVTSYLTNGEIFLPVQRILDS